MASRAAVATKNVTTVAMTATASHDANAEAAALASKSHSVSTMRMESRADRRQRKKCFPQARARRQRGGQIEGIDDGEAEPAGRHRMLFRLHILVKGDLHAGDTGTASYLI